MMMVSLEPQMVYKMFQFKRLGTQKRSLGILSLTHNLTEFDSSLVHCFDTILKPMFSMGPFCIETTTKEGRNYVLGVDGPVVECDLICNFNNKETKKSLQSFITSREFIVL